MRKQIFRNGKHNNDLPDGWAWSTIGEIISFEYGKGLRKDNRDESGNIPVYGSNGIVGYHSTALVEQPCLIIGRKGAAGAVTISQGPCWPIDTTYYVIPPSEIDLSYLYYLLSSLNLESLDRSTAIPGLNRNDAYQLSIPLAPFPEQQRMVAKIDELFSQLDAAVGDIKRVQNNLVRYKASVLKAACEGRLVPTEAELARSEGQDYESGEALLQRILAGRKKKWEEEQKAKGKDPNNLKYKDPELQDTKGLPELPEGWVWTTLPQIGDLARGKSKHRPRNDPKLYGGDYPFIQTGEISQAEGIITTYTNMYNEFGLAQSRLWPKGTLCITIAANIADTAILGFDSCFPDSIVGFIGDENVNVKFIEYFVRTAKEDLEKFAPATAQKNINLTILQNLAIPLPPLPEQERIVNELERKLSLVNELENTIGTNLKRSERLRQAILKRAFEGRLVPQDPEDEPAAVLLERMKSTKAEGEQLEMFSQ